MTFSAFVWGSRYLTGIPIIDKQHRRLVELINRLGEVMIDEKTARLPDVVAEVADYANYHFRTEEGIWESAGLAAEDQANHKLLHTDFVDQLGNFQINDGTAPATRAHQLHSFLSSWLIFHILGEDHELARQVLAYAPAEPAPQGEWPPQPSSIEGILLEALKNLYAALSAVNAKLRETNTSLETRVKSRTQELESLNEALVQERDLLALANSQLDETRSRLLESDKMASIGQLAAGVAHEINNPIGFVSSNLGTLGEYINDTFEVLDAYIAAEPLIARDPQAIAALRTAKAERAIDFIREDARSLLDETRDGLQRVKCIVQDLKTFSHVDQSEWQQVDLQQGLESTVNIVMNELRQKAELHREYGDMPKVTCNAGQLNQVFMNLLINAAQAIERHGVITVRTGAGNGEAWVEIEDNGCGIKPEHRARMFEPFSPQNPLARARASACRWPGASSRNTRVALTWKAHRVRVPASASPCRKRAR